MLRGEVTKSYISSSIGKFFVYNYMHFNETECFILYCLEKNQCFILDCHFCNWIQQNHTKVFNSSSYNNFVKYAGLFTVYYYQCKMHTNSWMFYLSAVFMSLSKKNLGIVYYDQLSALSIIGLHRGVPRKSSIKPFKKERKIKNGTERM